MPRRAGARGELRLLGWQPARRGAAGRAHAPRNRRRAQVVSLHCNLDANTHHLINKQRLALMKKDAVLVNAARGPCIDEAALVEHLKANPDVRRCCRRCPWPLLQLPQQPAALLAAAARGPRCCGARLSCSARGALPAAPLTRPAAPAPPAAAPQFRVGLDVFEDEPVMKPGLEKQPNAVIVPHIASASMWTRSGMVRRRRPLPAGSEAPARGARRCCGPLLPAPAP